MHKNVIHMFQNDPPVFGVRWDAASWFDTLGALSALSPQETNKTGDSRAHGARCYACVVSVAATMVREVPVRLCIYLWWCVCVCWGGQACLCDQRGDETHGCDVELEIQDRESELLFRREGLATLAPLRLHGARRACSPRARRAPACGQQNLRVSGFVTADGVELWPLAELVRLAAYLHVRAAILRILATVSDGKEYNPAYSRCSKNLSSRVSRVIRHTKGVSLTVATIVRRDCANYRPSLVSLFKKPPPHGKTGLNQGRGRTT